MKISLLACILPIALISNANMASAADAASGEGIPDVHVALTAKKLTSTSGNKESAEASEARPGDLIEYKAVYQNQGKGNAKHLQATLPIPAASMEYVPAATTPANVQASLDGKHFDTPPLKRSVTLADGRKEMQAVPASEYRFLRWDIGDLPAGKSTTVAARMKLVGSGLRKEGSK